VCLAVFGCGETPIESDTEAPPDPEGCRFDAAEGASSALPLTAEVPTDLWLCPVADQDWFSYAHSGGLLRVELQVDGPVSPIQPTFVVWDAAAAEPLAGPGSAEAAGPGAPLGLWMAVPAQTVLVQVRDQGQDDEDVRRAVRLIAQSRPETDATEPNDAGRPLPASPVTGAVASRGDLDRFTLDAKGGQRLEIELQAPAGGYQPSLVIRDPAGVERLTLASPAGLREPTLLTWSVAVDQEGPWTLDISDDDRVEHDPDTAWTLTWALLDDPDVNEPNGHPSLATDLGGGACESGGVELPPAGGYLAATGDVDWYRLDVTGCERGLIEADLDFDTVSPLPADFRASLRLVRGVPGATCTRDQDCGSLPKTCRDDLDCEGIGNLCLGDGFCAGAGVCLPDGVCGGHSLILDAPTAEPGQVALSAPLGGNGRWWLAVSEQRGDARAPEVPYALSARLARDPDPFEPNHVWTAGPPRETDAGRHARRATPLTVHDCRPPIDPLVEPDCCDAPEDFTTGHLAFAWDQDWFRYDHPCPDQDCMVRIHLRADEGPVDMLTQVWIGGDDLWYDGLLDTIDRPNQAAQSVVYGGLESTDECFYAYRGHEARDGYAFSIRDTIWRGSSDPLGGTWDWSRTQSYAVCVEVVADGCVAPPCKVFSDGCGSP
jgi:hypothetical protein